MSRQEPVTDAPAAELWPDEVPDDVRAFLDQNPALRRNRALALDLAYDEYCRLAEGGETPDPETFCARFPTYHSALRKAIQAHEYLAANPHLLDEPTPIPWPVEGETFLGFRLLRELGRGAFARVFLAAEPDLGDRLVAVKISPHGGTEAHTLGRIDHPNVVKVHAVRKDEASGLTAVCMPYLGGATLEGVLAAFATGRPQSARVILAAGHAAGGGAVGHWPAPHALLETGSYAEGVCLLGAQLAEALAFLHARKIFHRDLKPSNVLLCPDGRPMLLDFNLSADHQAHRECRGGTLPYMSPEQVTATFAPGLAPAAPLDARSDLYSLGVILFQLLSGGLPFGAVPRGVPSEEECAEVLARQLKGVGPVRTLCPGATPNLARVITSCLAFDRERRPRGAAEVAAALRRDLTLLRRVLRRLRRQPWRLAIAATALLGLAWPGAAYLVARPSAGGPMIAEVRAADAAGEPANAMEAEPADFPQPGDAKAHFELARQAQRGGLWVTARDEFRHANSLAPEPRLRACIAYCMSRSGDHSGAVTENKRAIEQNYRTAAVYNNLAYSLMNDARFPEAREPLARAIAAAPRLAAARLNHLDLLRQELHNSERRLWRLADVPGALADALDVCPESAELYGAAADLCAAAGRREPGWDDQTLTHLEHAVRLGLELGFRPNHPLYDHLRMHPRFIALLRLRPPAVPPQLLQRVVDPLDDRMAAP